ncbi:MAG: hypothetical protein JSS09_09505, partial [Verrucomicrobia bacterium]|nr:hypothetical protein [Verrucomicrobiota bacterium]
MSIPSTPQDDLASKSTAQTQATAAPPLDSANNSFTNNVVLSTLLNTIASATASQDANTATNEANASAEEPTTDTTGLSSSQKISRQEGETSDDSKQGGSAQADTEESPGTSGTSSSGTSGTGPTTGTTTTPPPSSGGGIDPLTGKMLTPPSTQSTASTSDTNSSIDLRSMKEEGASTAEASSQFSTTAPTLNAAAIAASLNTFAPDLMEYGPSVGMSATTIQTAASHFQQAAGLAQKLNTLSTQGAPQAVLSKVQTSMETQITQGYQTIVSSFANNPSSLENMFIQSGLPAGLSSNLTNSLVNCMNNTPPTAVLNQIIALVNASSGSSTSNTSTSAAYNPLNDTAGITAMANIIGGFVANANMGTVMMLGYETDITNINTEIGSETVSESNTLTKNTISDVQSEEKKEDQVHKKKSWIQKLTDSLTIIAAVVMVVVGACCEATGVGTLAGAALDLVAVGMITGAVSNLSGGPTINVAGAITNGLVKIGMSEKDAKA